MGSDIKRSNLVEELPISGQENLEGHECHPFGERDEGIQLKYGHEKAAETIGKPTARPH